MVQGPGRGGARLAIVGDTAETDRLVAAVRGADLLVVEATFLARDAALARERRHITAAEAGRLARDAGVGALILNHVSGRYPAAEIAAEAAALFAETRVAADFDRIPVVARSPQSRATPAFAGADRAETPRDRALDGGGASGDNPPS
jgi:ribonuclease Z